MIRKGRMQQYFFPYHRPVKSYYFFKQVFGAGRRNTIRGTHVRLVHVLKGQLYLLQEGGIRPLCDGFRGGQFFIGAQFVGLFVPFVFEFDTDTLAGLEDGNFQGRVRNFSDYSHVRFVLDQIFQAGKAWPARRCKNAKVCRMRLFN